MPILLYLWQRFLWLGWIAKGITAAVVLYGLGWVFGKLGADSAARSLASAAITVGSVAVAALVIRELWRRSTAHHGSPR